MKLKEVIFKSSKSKFVTWLLIYLAFAFVTSLAFCDIHFTNPAEQQKAMLELQKQKLKIEAKLYPKGKTRQDHLEELADTIEYEISDPHKQSFTNTLVGIFSYLVILLIWALPGTLFIYETEINQRIPTLRKIKRLKNTNSFVIVAIIIAAACLAFGSIFGGLVYIPK